MFNYLVALTFCIIATGCQSIVPQTPLKVHRLNQGNVLDLSCEIGYFLNLNISARNSMMNNQSDSELFSSLSSSSYSPKTLTTAIPFHYTTVRLYCVAKRWMMDNLSAVVSDRSGILPRIPILSPPVCNGKSFNDDLSLCVIK